MQKFPEDELTKRRRAMMSTETVLEYAERRKKELREAAKKTDWSPFMNKAFDSIKPLTQKDLFAPPPADRVAAMRYAFEQQYIMKAMDPFANPVMKPLCDCYACRMERELRWERMRAIIHEHKVRFPRRVSDIPVEETREVGKINMQVLKSRKNINSDVFPEYDISYDFVAPDITQLEMRTAAEIEKWRNDRRFIPMAPLENKKIDVEIAAIAQKLYGEGKISNETLLKYAGIDKEVKDEPRSDEDEQLDGSEGEGRDEEV